MKEIYGHITESKTTVSVAKRVCKDKKFKLILKSMLSRGIRFQIYPLKPRSGKAEAPEEGGGSSIDPDASKIVWGHLFQVSQRSSQ